MNERILACERWPEGQTLSLDELCKMSRVERGWVIELVEHGVVEPLGPDRTIWCFRVSELRRVRRAMRLRHDLGVNVPGIALALELLDRLERLRRR